VRVGAGGRIEAFATFMTGELYAVLLGHSILGRMAADTAAQPGAVAGAAYDRGLARGLAAGGLAHDLFGARTLALAGELAPTEVGEWLSGLLVGREIREARAWAAARGDDAVRVRVIGNDALTARYTRALATAGIAAVTAPPDAAARGLWTVARRAGLIGTTRG
jgi:2-dehydro-3-deoxygalactonokinase